MTFKHIILYFITLAVFIGIDSIWLGVISKDFYRNFIGHLMASKFKLAPAIIFYLIFVAVLIILCVIPGIEQKSLVRVIVFCGLFGLATYATYDLTNYATLDKWPLNVVLVDIAWGAFIAITTGTASFYIAGLLGL